jgi:ferric-dicitrate binding protein FerR (iron transport regulator)
MTEKMTDFLWGLMPEDEKLNFLREVERNKPLRKKLAAMQNNFALAKMQRTPADEQLAATHLKVFMQSVNRITFYRVARQTLRYAAVILIAFGVGFALNAAFAEPPEMALYAASASKRTEVTLPDGTHVWLAPASTLAAPQKFSRKKREVALVGEAFFEVAHDAEKPFIVNAGSYNIRVLGTKFNVLTRPQEATFEAYLQEGSVEVFNLTECIRLLPHEGVAMHSNRLEKTTPNMAQISYMQTGIYAFEHRSLIDLIRKMEQEHSIKFTIASKRIASCSLTGKFKEGDNLETMLAVLQRVCPFQYKKVSDNVIEIY